MILGIALDLATGAVALAMLLCGWRLMAGPSLPDRVLALDTLAINAVALVVLLGLRWQTGMLFEAALIIAMLGFGSTVVLSKFVLRRDIVE